MNMKKVAVRNAMDYFKAKSSRIPTMEKLTQENIHEILDKERILQKDFIKNTNSSAVQDIINSTRALNYVNDIKTEQEIKEIHRNMSEEINKNFEIKPVQPSPFSKRVGLLGYKVGMMTVWDKFGTAFPLTVVKVDNCQVVEARTQSKHGYDALVVSVGTKEARNSTKSEVSHALRRSFPIPKDIKEFKITPENKLPVGYMLTARHFTPGQLVDVKGISKGKGTQGVMVRWNFAGGFKTHGASLSHRSGGSIGGREKPGKVWKGKKMAGHCGNESVTVQSLRVFRIDHDRNLLFLKGSVPGNTHGLLYLRDCIKKPQIKVAHFPTFVPDKNKIYPNILEWTESTDLNEKYQHDNDEVLGISDEEEEGEPEKGIDEDPTAKK